MFASKKLFPILCALAMVAVATSASAQERRMNGRYARGAGETVPTFGAGERGGYVGFDPYAGSYLPAKSGPMMKQNDREIARKIKNGFGDCDLVHQIIKDNADLDTAAKLDKSAVNAGGTGNLRERYEREGFRPDAEGWEGFCHNWAPATLDKTIDFMVSMDRIYADVPFGIGDYRELATFTYPGESRYSNSFKWFGKRNNNKTEPEPEADNMDPVDLITIFENYVGEGKPGIVMDVDPGYMVWNQPFHKWNMNSEEVSGDEAGPKQPPAGGKAFKVKLTGEYGKEGSYANRGGAITTKQTWNMFVYTDASGKIVDSAWDGRNKIPDFAWMITDLGTSPDWENFKRAATEGVSVNDIEEFCKAMAALPEGEISADDAAKLKALLDKICPVLDQNKLSAFIRTVAERTGQDYTNLEDAIRSESEARG